MFRPIYRFLGRRLATHPAPKSKARHLSCKPGFEQLESRDAPAVFTVTDNGDTGPNTLRGMIAGANTGDTIRFDVNSMATSTIRLNTEILSDKSLTIDGQSLNNNVRIVGGGTTRAFLFSGESAVHETIQYIRFHDCNATGDIDGSGGAVYVTAGSLTLISDVFTNNTGTFGGAVALTTESATDALEVSGTGTLFRGNSADDGGAIYVDGSGSDHNDGGGIFLWGAAFTDNHATTGSGGAVCTKNPVAGAPFLARDCMFQQNGASNSGGAIFTSYDLGVFAVNSVSTFYDNRSGGAGGAIVWRNPYPNVDATLSIFDVTFRSNRAVFGGGVAAITDKDSATMSEVFRGCLFDSNQATVAPPAGTGNDGGGLYVENDTIGTGAASLSVTNSTLYNNTATTTGGGLFLLNTNEGTGANTALINSVTVALNSAGRIGGGLWTVTPTGNGRLTVSNSIIAGNTATTDGSDIEGTVNSLGFNLIGSTGGNAASNWNANDITGTDLNPVDPGLDTTNGLRDNGGLTYTIAVLTTSLAYRSGDLTLWDAANDQRGLLRNGVDQQGRHVVTRGAYDNDAS
jgi:predicted outer membrane repeat protein